MAPAEAPDARFKYKSGAYLRKQAATPTWYSPIKPHPANDKFIFDNWNNWNNWNWMGSGWFREEESILVWFSVFLKQIKSNAMLNFDSIRAIWIDFNDGSKVWEG